MTSPFSVPNIRLFIGFRLLFNARFYYPVFTVLFLDLGLTLEQFLLLNAVWAATILLLEVPSGAMADTIGRRNLVVIAAVCMIAEMALLCFLPIGQSTIVFWGLLLNRVISGTAEAMASGADEALAFDSLKARQMENLWPRVLDVQMRCQSAAFVVAMLLGGVLYDARAVNWLLGLFGYAGELSSATTLRFPLYLCLGTACAALVLALRMRDPQAGNAPVAKGAAVGTAEAYALVMATARWIFRSPAVLILIAVAVTFDSTARTVITLASEYYRYIRIPEYIFGVFGAISGVIGIFTPIAARWLVENRSATFNACLLAGLLGVTLIGMSFTIPYWGVLPVFGIGLTLTLVHFFSSHYLNQLVTDSSRRATVLSFRSLAANLAYGLAGLVYMGVTHALRGESDAAASALGEPSPVFGAVMAWTPAYYLVTLLALLLAIFFIRSRLIQPPLKS